MSFLLTIIVILSVLTVVGSIVAIPILLLRLPADYLTREDPPEDSFRFRHPVLRYVLRLSKNMLGVLFVIVGIALLPGPGQGLLTIIIGLSLMDFPGKRAWELRLIGQRRVLNVINLIRVKAGRPPLESPQVPAGHQGKLDRPPLLGPTRQRCPEVSPDAD